MKTEHDIIMSLIKELDKYDLDMAIFISEEYKKILNSKPIDF